MNNLDRLFQLSPGGLLGNQYRLDRCLGDGTYGFVWKAERLRDHQVVAVKIPKQQGGKNSDLEEGHQLIGAPSNPNVISVYWMGRVLPEREVYAIEMEYFNSHTLAFLLDAREERLTAGYRYLLGLFGQVLDGVCFLHGQTITHGDLKPQNILVGGDVAKLTDFGNSLTTQDIYARSRENGGTVLYSPPELAGLTVRKKSGALAVAHDIYSLGVLLYQLLTGRLPHDTLAQVVKHSPFPRPTELNSTIAPGLDAVVMRALEAQPEDRWPSAETMRTAFLVGLQEQFASGNHRMILTTPARQRDWSSEVVGMMDQQEWRNAETVARSEFQRSGDPHAFLLMVRAAVRAERYFDSIHMLESNPALLHEDCPVVGDLELLALEAFLKTERINEASRMIDRCIARQGALPGLLLRKASLLGMQAKYREAREILLELNRLLPRRAVILRRLVLVHEQLREQEQAEAFRRVLGRVEATT